MTEITFGDLPLNSYDYDADFPPAELRNAVMRAKSPDDWYDIIDWLYGSTGLDGAASREMRLAAAG